MSTIYGSNKGNNFKVGLMVALGFILFLAANWIIRGCTISSDGYQITIVFQNLNGINEGSDIRLAGGKRIGTVRTITMREGLNYLDAWIQSSAKLNRASQATITSSSVLGEKYISLSYPRGQHEELSAGATIRGQDPISLMDSLNQFGKLMQNLNTVLGSETNNRLFQRLGDSIDSSATNLSGSLETLSRTVARLDRLMATLENSGTKIQTILDDLETTASASAKSVPPVLDNLLALSKELNGLLANLQKGKSVAGALLNNEAFYYDFKSVMENIKTLTYKLRKDPSILLWRDKNE